MRRPLSEFGLAAATAVYWVFLMWNYGPIWQFGLALLFAGWVVSIFVTKVNHRLNTRTYGRDHVAMVKPIEVTPKPQSWGAFAFYVFLDFQKAEAVEGDLLEKFDKMYRKFGKFRAHTWFWKEVIQSVGPVAWYWAKRVLKGVTGITALMKAWGWIRG